MINITIMDTFWFSSVMVFIYVIEDIVTLYFEWWQFQVTHVWNRFSLDPSQVFYKIL